MRATGRRDRPVDDSLRAVADPTRRAILRLVRNGELAAGEISTHFTSMSRPAVSQHLRVLADAGLLMVRPAGNRRLYRWRPEGLRDAAALTGGAPDVALSSTRVEVTLTPHDGDTIPTVRHDGLPAVPAGEHRAGWVHSLPRLAAVVPVSEATS